MGDAAAGTRLVDALVQSSLHQMLESGYFHADPHAGNLLATQTGELCYLDFGMMFVAAARAPLVGIARCLPLAGPTLRSDSAWLLSRPSCTS